MILGPNGLPAAPYQGKGGPPPYPGSYQPAMQYDENPVGQSPVAPGGYDYGRLSPEPAN